MSEPGRFEGTLSAAELDVILECRRHAEEGWTPEHDDEHTDGCLATAAACYAAPDAMVPEAPQRLPGPRSDGPNFDRRWRLRWPWDWEWWKPKDRRRDLVRAGSLIIKEIERLDRAAAKAGDTPRTAPDCCPNCHDESDCSSIDVCAAVDAVYPELKS